MSIDVPATGGSYTRDPVTGALAPVTDAPSPASNVGSLPADPAPEPAIDVPAAKVAKKEK